MKLLFQNDGDNDRVIAVLGVHTVKHEMGGNGSGKFNIHHLDMGGWVRTFADRDANLPADLPVYLSSSLMVSSGASKPATNGRGKTSRCVDV